MSAKGAGDPYMVSNLLSFSSTTKRAAFIKGLGFVMNRHDVFRTGVISSGLSETVQVVLKEVELPVSVLAIDKDKDTLVQIKEEFSPDKLSMDLTKAPMMRIAIADDQENRAYYLVLNHHHLMVDHIGMAKVREEIMFYLSGKKEQLPTPSLYRDCLLYTSPSPRDRQKSRMPSSA